MPQFMLILHETPSDFAELAPAQMQAVIEEYTAWAMRMGEEGRLSGHNKLGDEGGRSLSTKAGKLEVVDGPYAEAKEVIGGYFVLEAESYEHATELAGSCPHVRYGRIELRQVDVVEGGA